MKFFSWAAALISRASIGGRVYSWCPVTDGFAVENTRAMCWQFSPAEKAFVVVGGWTT